MATAAQIIADMGTAGVPAAITAALAALGAVQQGDYVASLAAMEAGNQTIKAAVAAAARAAGGAVPPGTYSGQYINLVGDTVIKPASFTTWANNESLLVNFDGVTQTNLLAANGAAIGLVQNSLDVLSANMFLGPQAMAYALTYYPDGNTRIKLPKLITTKPEGYATILTSLRTGLILPGAAAALAANVTPALTDVNTDLVINSNNMKALPEFAPYSLGVEAVNNISGKMKTGTTYQNISVEDAANLKKFNFSGTTESYWTKAATFGQLKAHWTTPPNFLHWTDIKLKDGASYNDAPRRFQVSRTSTDASSVLVVTCMPGNTSFIPFSDSNFMLPTGWRISRRLYDGMIVYTGPDNITQTHFPDGTFYKISGSYSYIERPFLTKCAEVALAKLSDAAFVNVPLETKHRAAELFCCIKLAIKIQAGIQPQLGGGGGGGGNNAQLKMQIPRLYSKKSYNNNRRTKNKNRNKSKSKSMSMFKSAKRAFYRTNKRNKTSRK